MKTVKPALSGRVALISGAGSGFGRAMSIAFCEAGAQVFGVGRRIEKLEETSKFAGPGFVPLVGDVTDTDGARDLVKQVMAKANALHILINNAGVLLDDDIRLSQLDWDVWEKTWKTNVSGTLALTQAAFEAMRKQRYGRIANVTSGLGFFPMLEYGSYCISKAAVNMMTRVFALDGASDNILVNAIDPGVAKTEMNPSADEPPESVNDVALYLASVEDFKVTGKCFNKKLRCVEW